MVQQGSACLRRLAFGDEAMEIRFGRLLRHSKVTVSRILDGACEATASAVAGRHTLAVQDTSEIHLRTHPHRQRGLGKTGKGVGRGLLLHPMIAVDADSRECLGLVGGTLWTREDTPPGQTRPSNKARPLEEKESRHWVETAQEAKPVLRRAAMVTLIADREGDFYQLWAGVPEEGVHVLGRCYQDRLLVGGGRLLTAAAGWPCLNTRTVQVSEKPGRAAREATLELRAGTVTFERPESVRERDLPDRITRTLIELTEPNPPADAEPVLWRLLTTHEAADGEAGWRIVDWYRSRWIIEQLFRTMKKQGLEVEDSQVETADRLLKLVAIATRAAVIVMQLTQARDGASSLSAQDVFSPAEVETMEALERSYGSTPKRRNPHPRHSLPWATWIIARLGGCSGYKSDKPPGPVTIKNGLHIMKTMAQGLNLRDMYTP